MFQDTIRIFFGRPGPKGADGATTWAQLTGKPSAFTPSPHAATHAANGSDPLTLSPSQIAGTAVVTGDTRLSDPRTPTGPAGGVLAGTFPNPTFATPMATQAALTSGLAGKADLVGGVIPTEQMPAIAVSKYCGSVASDAAMQALKRPDGTDMVSGDWCNRSDTHKAMVLIAAPASTLGNWQTIEYPLSPVLSVNGQVGSVVLGASSVGLGNVVNALQLLASDLDTDSTFAANSNAKIPSQAAVKTALALKAPLNAPAFTGAASFTGTVTAPTRTAGDNTTYVATTAFVTGAISTVNTSLAAKAPIASPTFTGIPSAPTALSGNSSTQLATTAFVGTAVLNGVSGKADKTTLIQGGGMLSGGGSIANNQVINLTKATQAQAEAGTDDTTGMTPFLVAKAIAALSAGGSGSNGLKGVAFFAGTANGGDDTTAQLGNPSKPYGTIQAAWNATYGQVGYQTGSIVMLYQSGDYLNIQYQTGTLNIYGCDREMHYLPGINILDCSSFTIAGNGRSRVSVGAVTCQYTAASGGNDNSTSPGTNGGDGYSGTGACTLKVKQVFVSGVFHKSQNGGNGGNGGAGQYWSPYGGNGGNGGTGAGGGTLIIEDCFLGNGATFSCRGGDGGPPGSYGIGFTGMDIEGSPVYGSDGSIGNPGNGGLGGNIYITNSHEIPTSGSTGYFDCAGGTAGATGTPAVDGWNGYLYGSWSEYYGHQNVSGGSLRMCYRSDGNGLMNDGTP